MKKFIITALMVCIALGAFALDYDPSMIDMSKAEMSLAGPDSVYVSNIYYGDTRLSALLKYNGATGATIQGLYYDDQKLLPDSTDFGQVELRLLGNDTLIISKLVIFGAGVSGRFEYDGEFTLDLASWWQTEKPVSYEAQALALKEQLATSQKRYEEEIAATKGKYMADIAELEADNDELAAEVAKLTADVEKLESSVDGYESQIAGLRRRAAEAATASGERLLENMMFSAPIDRSMFDFSKAEMAIAGPESIYVTSIYYGDTRFSVLLKYDGATGATIYGPYYDGDKLLLDSFEMGYADLRMQGNDALIISDLVLYGQGITGRFEYDGRSTLSLKSWWESKTPQTYESRIAELENQLEATKQRHAQEMEATKGKYTADIAKLEETLNDLYARIDVGQRDYENQIARLQRQLQSAGVDVKMAVDMPTRSIVSNATVARGSALYGNWNVTTEGATQTDTSAYFAKFSVPVAQSADQTLYSFTARAANATDFVGYGAHIFASGDTKKIAYGFGNSYLVWITRDPDFYRNDNTYIQIYRSYDDVKMVQVASVATAENIARSNDVEILYDKVNGELTVSMNGTQYVSYDLVDVIESGTKVAIRTLGGPVTFSNADVKVK